MSKNLCDVEASRGVAHSWFGGMNKMVNNLRNKKHIAQLSKKFHEIVSKPPEYNPFTSEGYQAWEAWANECRKYEIALTAAGVEL